MARLKVRSVIQIIVLFAVCVASAIIGYALRNNNAGNSNPNQPSALQQSDEKVIDWQRHQNEPFEVSDLSVQATSVILGEKLNVRTLPENRNWLKDLQFAIKNESDKQITYLAYSLIFPQAIISGGQLVYTLDVGVPPSPLKSMTGNTKPLVIHPEDKFKVTLSDMDLTLINKILSRSGLHLADLTRVTLRIETIILGDGMKWDGGYFYKPDTSTPGKYERINQ
jgi:hypothetical protein